MHCILSYFYQNTYLHAPIGNLALHFTHHLSGATFGGLMGGGALGAYLVPEPRICAAYAGYCRSSRRQSINFTA